MMMSIFNNADVQHMDFHNLARCVVHLQFSVYAFWCTNRLFAATTVHAHQHCKTCCRYMAETARRFNHTGRSSRWQSCRGRRRAPPTRCPRAWNVAHWSPTPGPWVRPARTGAAPSESCFIWRVQIIDSSTDVIYNLSGIRVYVDVLACFVSHL